MICRCLKGKYFKSYYDQGLFLQQTSEMGEDNLSGLILIRKNASTWCCRLMQIAGGMGTGSGATCSDGNCMQCPR